MVRALPDKKAHTDKKKGTEPLGRKVKDKPITVEENSTPSRKKFLKELPVGILPKTENPILDKEWEDNNVKALLEFERKIERQHPPELAPNVPIFPKQRAHWITNPHRKPPTRGGGVMLKHSTEKIPEVWGGGCSFLASF